MAPTGNTLTPDNAALVSSLETDIARNISAEQSSSFQAQIGAQHSRRREHCAFVFESVQCRSETNTRDSELNLSLVIFSETESDWNPQTSDGVLIAELELKWRGATLLTDEWRLRQRLQGKRVNGGRVDNRIKSPESRRTGVPAGSEQSEASLHPSWRAFVQYCREMGHGEIERLKIQDGIPVLVEVSRQKIKFS